MQRRNVDLPEPDGAEQAHHLAALHLQRDPPQYLLATEALVHAFGADHRRAHRCSPPSGGGGPPGSLKDITPRRTRPASVAPCSRAVPRP